MMPVNCFKITNLSASNSCMRSTDLIEDNKIMQIVNYTNGLVVIGKI